MLDSTKLRAALLQTINKVEGTGRADKAGNYVILSAGRRVNKFDCKLSLACLSCYNVAETTGSKAECYAYDLRKKMIVEPAIFKVDQGETEELELSYKGVHLDLGTVQ